MAPRVMLFAGAPPPSAVNAASCTLDSFDPIFRRFIDGQDYKADTPAVDPSSAGYPAWRLLPLHQQQPFPSGLSQLHSLHDSLASPSHDFFTTADVSNTVNDTDQDVLSQFCEQSLALHNPLPSSQLGSGSSIDQSTSLADTSASSTAPQPITPCHLSDLEDVPPAPRVIELSPQTITVNLIVGIISIAQPRTVTTRWGTTLSLIELLVGDDTKSGFGVTFWLSSDSIPENQLSRLRRQEIVLMRNIALHVFQNKVYGQSLRKGLTQIHLLWSRNARGHYSTRHLARRDLASDPQIRKTRNVKDWVLNFVAVDRPSTSMNPRHSWGQPPDDTQ